MRNRRVYRSIVSDTIAPDHFLKKVFKKKPGGTAIGNLIRLGVNKASGGILGTGANRLPIITSSTPIAETVAKSTDAAIKQSVLNLSQQAKERLLNGQTSVSNLPKTKQLRNAERVAEQMKDEKPVQMSTGVMTFNPMVIGGVIVGVIVLVIVMRKV
jgi:hypothetical protein